MRSVVRDNFVGTVLEDISHSITQHGGQWNGLNSLCLLLIQRELHGLALEDELILGEWQCKGVSFKLYDILYCILCVEWAVLARFLDHVRFFLAPSLRKTREDTYAIIDISELSQRGHCPWVG